MNFQNIFHKTLILSSFLIIFAVAFLAEATETFRVDGVHSSVIFRIKHLNLSYAYGRFNEPSGTFILDTKNPEKSSVDIKIEVSKLDTFSEKRDQHLRSPDFFNGKQFPVIMFKSQKIKKIDVDTFDVTGDLTLRGVTKKTTLRVEHTGFGKDPMGGFRAGFESTITLKRSDYGMNFMLGPIGDEVRITVSIEGIRQ